MINNRFPTAFGILVVLAALAAPANAVEHAIEVPALPTPGNAAEAEAILGAKLLVCNTCHGNNGIPRNAAVPVIWGLQENYLLKQLHDFTSGVRDNEVMTWMATALTQNRVGARGGLFGKKKWAGAAGWPRGAAARRSGRMPGLPSAELGGWPAGPAAGRPEL